VAGGQTDLGEDRSDVALDCLLSDEESIGDGPVGPSLVVGQFEMSELGSVDNSVDFPECQNHASVGLAHEASAGLPSSHAELFVRWR